MERDTRPAACDADLFVHCGPDTSLDFGGGSPVSYWSDVFRRFTRQRSAVVFGAMLVLIILGCFLIPPVIGKPIAGVMEDAINAPPSARHWLGADRLGHDIFTKVWKGGQVSFTVGFTAAILQAVIGTLIGGMAAYNGGWVETATMRVVDVLISIPYLIIVLCIRMIAGPGEGTIIFALVVTGWMNIARLTRGQVLQLMKEDYVTAARFMGVRPASIMLRHLIPNTLGVLIVSFTLGVPQAMFSEAFLSFIGMGSNAVSWGSLIRSGMETRFTRPLQLVVASGLLALTMLCIQLVGDSLRDALDPKLRK